MSSRFRQSEISSWQRCRRKTHFGYGLNITPVAIGPRKPSSGQRDAGSAAHLGVEMINRGYGLDDALVAVTDYINELRMIRQPEGHILPELTKEDDKEWWTVWRLAQAMTTNYVAWLEEGNEVGVKFLSIEEDWEVQIPDSDFVLFGKIDAVIFDPLLDGEVVRDYKSVATFGQTPMDVDFQLRTYAWARWRLSGTVPVRAEHLMMKRVLGTGNAKPPFFERYSININRHILEVHENHLISRVIEMAAHRGTNAEDPRLWPNPTKDCSWDCDYKDLCPAVDNGMDWEDMIEEYYDVRVEGE